MRALVTGCAGFIGSHLTEALLASGADVRGVDCFNENYARAEKLANLAGARDWDGFDFVPVDLARGALHDLVDDRDVVFHLAAEPGVRTSWGARFETYLRNNVLATQHLLEAVRRAPGRRVVVASSSSVYGQAETLPTPETVTPAPISPYGVTKLAAEQLCRTYAAGFGVDVVSLRLFSVYGPRQRPDMAFSTFCAAALAGRAVTVYGTGEQTRDFTYVGDVVRALRSAATAEGLGGAVLNVGGGEQVSVNGALAALGEILGRPVAANRIGAERGDVRDTAADTTLARDRLGFSARVRLAEGLAAQVAAAQAAGPQAPAAA
jgi:nucleoside-diphosphate-sugar epimerase